MLRGSTRTLGRVMANAAAPTRARWPIWLICASTAVGVPLSYQVMFGPSGFAHTSKDVVLVLAFLLGCAVIAVWALYGIVVLARRPLQRTPLSYCAVLLALLVAALVFVPPGSLR